MVWTVIVLLLLFWVVGFAFDVFGGFVHLLLLAAVVVFILKLVGGRRKIAG